LAVLPAAATPRQVAFIRQFFLPQRPQRSQRGEPAAQRPSSSTSSPLPPLPYVEFHIRQQRCPIPLCVPQCPLWLKRKTTAGRPRDVVSQPSGDTPLAPSPGHFLHHPFAQLLQLHGEPSGQNRETAPGFGVQILVIQVERRRVAFALPLIAAPELEEALHPQPKPRCVVALPKIQARGPLRIGYNSVTIPGRGARALPLRAADCAQKRPPCRELQLFCWPRCSACWLGGRQPASPPAPIRHEPNRRVPPPAAARW